jgi:hypothetical protein
MNESIKSNIGVIAFVSIISLLSFIAYKMKDISFSFLKDVMKQFESVIGKDSEQNKSNFDFVTILIVILFTFTFIQLYRLKK